MVCPRGGAHEWEYHHRGNVSAGAVTGTAGVCSLLFCWPALFCLPLIYVGTAKGVKVTSDRKCLRCGLVITHDGRMKAPPTGVRRRQRCMLTKLKRRRLTQRFRASIRRRESRTARTVRSVSVLGACR